MSSVVLFLEGRFLGYTGAIATGAVGNVLGGLTGAYQAKKADDAEQELNRNAGRPDNPGSGVVSPLLHAAGGFIPGVGIVTNLIAANRRYALEDRVKAQDAKLGKPT